MKSNVKIKCFASQILLSIENEMPVFLSFTCNGVCKYIQQDLPWEHIAQEWQNSELVWTF